MGKSVRYLHVVNSSISLVSERKLEQSQFALLGQRLQKIPMKSLGVTLKKILNTENEITALLK